MAVMIAPDGVTPGQAAQGQAANVATATTPANQSNLVSDLKAMFPWLDRIGLSMDWFRDLAAEATSSAEILARLRSTSEYQKTFPGIYRQDGTMRMSEGEYFQTQDAYRSLLRQYGRPDAALDNPQDFIGFFEGDISPNELNQRLDTWQKVQTSGQDLKDAFYVYAGVRLSDEQLYEAVVDPAASQQLVDEYNQKVASQPFDYGTWIKRATEAGQARVANTLGELQKSGKLTGAAIQGVLSAAPDFAAQIMDVLYHGGDGGAAGQFLNLQELLNSYEYAAIGAAASGAGLNLPSLEMVQQIRAAGIDRAKASASYVDFANQQGQISGAVQRATNSQMAFGQEDFEKAVFLGNASSADLLQRALKQEQSLGESEGSTAFDRARSGVIRQQGLRPY